jgi:hypothetical protein
LADYFCFIFFIYRIAICHPVVLGIVNNRILWPLDLCFGGLWTVGCGCMVDVWFLPPLIVDDMWAPVVGVLLFELW